MGGLKLIEIYLSTFPVFNFFAASAAAVLPSFLISSIFHKTAASDRAESGEWRSRLSKIYWFLRRRFACTYTHTHTSGTLCSLRSRNKLISFEFFHFPLVCSVSLQKREKMPKWEKHYLTTWSSAKARRDSLYYKCTLSDTQRSSAQKSMIYREIMRLPGKRKERERSSNACGFLISLALNFKFIPRSEHKDSEREERIYIITNKMLFFIVVIIIIAFCTWDFSLLPFRWNCVKLKKERETQRERRNSSKVIATSEHPDEWCEITFSSSISSVSQYIISIVSSAFCIRFYKKRAKER